MCIKLTYLQISSQCRNVHCQLHSLVIMIPHVPVDHFLQVLQIFVAIIRHLASVRQHNDIEMAHIIMILNGSLQNCLQYLQMLSTYLDRNGRKRTKSLMKPHYLVTLFNAYRCNLHNNDVWMNMQQNWSHFFGLTGETPETLQVLVHRVSAKFENCKMYGPDTKLDLRNKVSRTLCLGTPMLSWYIFIA